MYICVAKKSWKIRCDNVIAKMPAYQNRIMHNTKYRVRDIRAKSALRWWKSHLSYKIFLVYFCTMLLCCIYAYAESSIFQSMLKLSSAWQVYRIMELSAEDYFWIMKEKFLSRKKRTTKRNLCSLISRR